MKYKASEIAFRAKQLADLTNTDFISNEEDIYYINDAWKEFYQLLINKGDKQFVKEVELAGSTVNGQVEYSMPDDCYQILSIKNNYGVITRKADSESNTSNTYEVVNDKIRLYGTQGHIIMTYYTVPEFITLPDKTIETDLTYNTVSTFTDYIQNSFINSDKNVYNARTSELVTTTDNSLILKGGKLGVYNNVLYDFDGNVVINGFPAYGRIVDSYGIKWTRDTLAVTAGTTWTSIADTKTLPAYTEGVMFKDGSVIGVLDNKLYLYQNEEQTDLNLNKLKDGSIYIESFGDHEFAYVGGYVFEYYNGTLQNYEEVTVPGKYLFPLKYGIVYYDGNVKIKSLLPDTEFNFQNELYVEVLAAALAIRYAMKQNANVEGLNNLYENMKGQFLNSLSQDSGYTRMNNVYSF